MATRGGTGDAANADGEGLEALGSGTQFVDDIYALVARSVFFAEFTREDIALLAGYMRIFRAQPGHVLIREGDTGDHMLLVIKGEIDIMKKNAHGAPQVMASVLPGTTLGEMSMIDGEPRFATCTAIKETTYGVLTRDAMVKIIVEKPSLGAKLMVKIVSLLSQRLRHTSARLMQYMK